MELSPMRMQLGYFQVIALPVSTWVREIFEFLPRAFPRFVTKLYIPPFPFLSPGYQFWIVEYFTSPSSRAMSSTTAAWSWFSSRIGAVQPSRYDTYAPLSAMIRVRSNWPVAAALIRKYVDSSIGHRTPGGMYAKEPSLKTAEFRAAKKLSLNGTTEPSHFRTRSGCSWTASENEPKMIPSSMSFALNVVATETLSRTASTATPASAARSWRGIPSRSYMARISGSTSSMLAGFFFGAA